METFLPAVGALLHMGFVEQGQEFPYRPVQIDDGVECTVSKLGIDTVVGRLHLVFNKCLSFDMTADLRLSGTRMGGTPPRCSRHILMAKRKSSVFCEGTHIT